MSIDRAEIEGRLDEIARYAITAAAQVSSRAGEWVNGPEDVVRI